MFGNVIDFSDKISVTRFSISIFFFLSVRAFFTA